MSDRYKCVLLFGAPGVGKGTQGARLGQEDGLIHLATGDIFRALDPESELGRKFKEYSSRGELVPDDLTITLWKEHVRGLIEAGSYDPASDWLVLDGMPRSVAQAEMLDDAICPLVLLHLTAPDLDVMVSRICSRAAEQGRADDANEDIVRKRFDVFAAETEPVLRHYDPSMVHNIDAIGTMDEVTERVKQALNDVRARVAC